jgi:hypothetical protein
VSRALGRLSQTHGRDAEQVYGRDDAVRQIRVFALLLAVLFVMIYLTPSFGDTLGPGSASPRVTGYARQNPLKSLQVTSPAPSEHDRKSSISSGANVTRSAGGLWIEAEEETAFHLTSSESGKRSSLHHFGESYWSLFGEGDYVEYSIEVPKEQMVYIWVRHLHNGGEQSYPGDLRIALNGITMSTVPEYPGQGNPGWAWTRVGWGHVGKDQHKLRITKAKSTQGPAFVDALYITPDGNAHPPMLASRGDSSG